MTIPSGKRPGGVQVHRMSVDTALLPPDIIKKSAMETKLAGDVGLKGDSSGSLPGSLELKY